MKIILKDDIQSLGKFGDVVKVANGYARNYLIPKGLAVNATGGDLKAIEQQKQVFIKKQRQEEQTAVNLKNELESISLSFARKTGEDEKLFGSVTSMDIESALKEKGHPINRKKINLAEPIRALGDFTVSVKIYPEIAANLKISVIKE